MQGDSPVFNDAGVTRVSIKTTFKIYSYDIWNREASGTSHGTEWEKEGREGKGRSERSWRRGETAREREGRGVGEEGGKEREREGKKGRGREGGGAFLASVTRLTQENASSNEKCN